MPPKRNFSDTELRQIANAVRKAIAEEGLPVPQPSKPLHEMTEWERTAYANETWAAAGIIPDRPNAGRTISDGGQ